ncbi:MAG: DUF5667 domain-containing protein [Gammaproteobacteria bacterium]|jgi:hypothetical protein|nr:DUF5667 domain-containing protein [Gammaproteobacteria bacterium]
MSGRRPLANARLAVFVLSLLAAVAAQAGHGLMNSFGDVEWLPDPGTTPDQLTYPLDRIGERAELALAESGEEALSLCLEFAREKLAEISAMVRAGEGQAAAAATAHYRGYLDRAAAAVEASPGTELSALRHRYVNALLEHVYIMSIDYMDMPLKIRESALAPLFATAMAHFKAQRAALSKGEKDALFFKEEEIRWSLEMAKRADEQGIKN